MQEDSQSAKGGGICFQQPHLDFKKSEGTIFYNEDLEYCIFNIIKSSEKYIFLVSPFIDLITHWQKLKRDITESYDNGKKIFFILKKPNVGLQDEKTRKDLKKIDELKENLKDKIELFLVDFLHSKIYLNDKQVLIASANLESYAFKNNLEIGCLIDDFTVSKWIVDNIIIKKILKSENIEHTKGKHAEWIIKGISDGKISDDGSDNDDNHSSVSNHDERKNNTPDNLPCESTVDNKESENNDQGYCIRCKKEIPFSFKKPVCDDCDVSNKDSNDGIYCHKCKTDKAYIAKNHPLCYPCYKKRVI